MQRIVSFIVLFFSLGILFSCTGTTNTVRSDNSAMGGQQYPSWYPDKTVVNTDTMMYAYATAIGEDSAASVSKAVAWAKSELKSSLSDKLEAIRSEAAVEYGSESGLDTSPFLIALRKADNVVNNLAKTGNIEVKTVEGYDSYRSFAEVMVPKGELIERIDKRLAGYENAWNAMKKSKAFESF